MSAINYRLRELMPLSCVAPPASSVPRRLCQRGFPCHARPARSSRNVTNMFCSTGRKRRQSARKPFTANVRGDMAASAALHACRPARPRTGRRHGAFGGDHFDNYPLVGLRVALRPNGRDMRLVVQFGDFILGRRRRCCLNAAKSLHCSNYSIWLSGARLCHFRTNRCTNAIAPRPFVY